MGMVGGRVGRIEPNGPLRERVLEITGGTVRLAPLRLVRCAPGRGEVEGTLGADIVDADQLRRSACLLERLGDHDRDRLVVVLDLRAAEQPGRVEPALAELAE